MDNSKEDIVIKKVQQPIQPPSNLIKIDENDYLKNSPKYKNPIKEEGVVRIKKVNSNSNIVLPSINNNKISQKEEHRYRGNYHSVDK